MFDKIYHPSKEYVPYEKSVTVNENKAPTDESIRLYKELVEKAHDSVLESGFISNNLIDFKYEVSVNISTREMIIAYKACINGHIIKNKKAIRDDASGDEKASALFNMLARDITDEILSKLPRNELAALFK